MTTLGQRVLVYCANGFQGRAIATALLDAGCQVRALVRDEAKASGLAAAGAELACADLADEMSLRSAHRDVDAVVIQLPSGSPPDQTRAQAAIALKALRAEGVQRAVLNTGVSFPRRVEELPGFAAKRDVERALLTSGLRVSVLRAPFLLSNLLLPWASMPVATNGVLTYPIAAPQPLSWAAPEDLGRLVALIIGNDLYGHTVTAGAAQAVRGEELAAAFSNALGRTISYVPLPLDEFEAGVDAAVGPGVGRQVGAIFRFIESYPDDRDFVTATYSAPAGFPPFQPTALRDWVLAHRDQFELNAAAANP